VALPVVLVELEVVLTDALTVVLRVTFLWTNVALEVLFEVMLEEEFKDLLTATVTFLVLLRVALAP
jgi:hypothetical protein